MFKSKEPSKSIDFLKIGKTKKLDLHGLTKEEAHYDLLATLNTVDVDIKAIEIIHGFHSGKSLKNLVLNEFKHPMILEKKKIDASRTLFILNWKDI